MIREEERFVLKCQELSYEDLSRDLLEKLTRNLAIPCEFFMGQDAYKVVWHNGSVLLD